MMDLIHMTAAYSNAVLVAVLPHVSDFANKLALPIPQPVREEQVAHFNPMPYKGQVEGALWLTNGYWFILHSGYVDSFRSPNDWFYEQDPSAHITNYFGHSKMSTNDVVAFARKKLLALGYGPDLTHSDTQPELEGPYDTKLGGHIPYCQVKWEPTKDQDSDGYSQVRVDINTQDGSVVGLYLSFARTNSVGTPLTVDIEPELESDFQKRTSVKMFVRSNAPPRIPIMTPVKPNQSE
ncbi:MAG: hypothetical protein U1F98_04305 [Verrucomicrobiota bacterium]